MFHYHAAVFSRRALAVIALGILVVAAGVWVLPLQEPDEGRYGEIAREMLVTGDWVTPHLSGIRYFEKPPLFFWTEALSIRLFGPNEVALRLPSVLSALGTLAIVLVLATSMFGSGVGEAAGALFITAPLVVFLSRYAIVDLVLMLLVTAALAAMHAAIVTWREDPSRRRLAVAAFYLFLGLATLTKGPVAIAIPGVTILIWAACARDWRAITLFLRLDGIALYLLIAVPWFALMGARHPTYLVDFFLRENLARFATGGVYKKQQPIWFYVPILLVGFFPWIFALIADAWRVRVDDFRAMSASARSRLFLGAWVVGPLALFTAAQSKLGYYLLPIFPPLAILAAEALLRERVDPRQRERLVRWIRFALIGFALITILIAGLALVVQFVPPRTLFEFVYRDHRIDRANARWFRLRLVIDFLRPAGVTLGFAALAATASAVLLGHRRIAEGFAVAVLSTCILTCAFPFVASVAAPTLSEKETTMLVRPALRDDDVLLFYKDYYRTVTFYLQRQVILWDAPEREFGHRPTAEDLEGHALLGDWTKMRRLLAGSRRVVIFVQDEIALDELRSHSPVPLYTVGESGPRRIVSNRKFSLNGN